MKADYILCKYNKNPQIIHEIRCIQRGDISFMSFVFSNKISAGLNSSADGFYLWFEERNDFDDRTYGSLLNALPPAKCL